MKDMKVIKKKQQTRLSKRDLYDSISTRSGLSKKGAGEFTLPGLVKFTTATRPAVKARKGINPFTGEEALFAARPESRTVRIRALKRLKGFANT